MMRPFTLICMASAFGAGLYLYQSKHTAQVLDREIVRTMKQTEVTRDRTGMLKAEWALLNEPDRLAELARAHLSLQTLKPTQFASMNDLVSRLPAAASARLETLPTEPVPVPEDAVPMVQAVPNVVPVAPVAKPREIVSAPEPKRIEPKPERAVAEAKPPRPVDKPVVARVEPPRPEPRFAEPAPVALPVHARAFAPPPPPPGSNDATAPGTIGAAVMRAMRTQSNGYAPAAPPDPAPRVYATPARAYVAPPPAYAPQGYAPAPSMLGGGTALPPPVPFGAR